MGFETYSFTCGTGFEPFGYTRGVILYVYNMSHRSTIIQRLMMGVYRQSKTEKHLKRRSGFGGTDNATRTIREPLIILIRIPVFFATMQSNIA